MLVERQAAVGPDGSVDALPDWGAPGHQRHSGRAAKRERIVAIQLDALLDQRIDVGRLDLAAVIANIVPAEVVGHHENDIRRRAGESGQCQPENSSNKHGGFAGPHSTIVPPPGRTPNQHRTSSDCVSRYRGRCWSDRGRSSRPPLAARRISRAPLVPQTAAAARAPVMGVGFRASRFREAACACHLATARHLGPDR